MSSTDASDAPQHETDSAVAHKEKVRGRVEALFRIQQRQDKRNSGLSKKLRKVLAGLGMTPQTRLKSQGARLILQLLGLELTASQQSQLQQTIERAHHYDGTKLKAWLDLNQSFVLYSPL